MSTEAASVIPTTTQPARRGPGRTSKRTPEAAAKIAELIRSGMSQRGAANAVGLAERTLYDWLRGDPGFTTMIDKARAESELALLQMAMEGARKDGRIALMMLARRFPESWGERQPAARVDVLHTHVAGSPEELLRLLTQARQEHDRRILEAGQVMR